MTDVPFIIVLPLDTSLEIQYPPLARRGQKLYLRTTYEYIKTNSIRWHHGLPHMRHETNANIEVVGLTHPIIRMTEGRGRGRLGGRGRGRGIGGRGDENR